MRILVDECLNWRICRALEGHYCVSVQKMDWAGLKNGALLEKAEKEFDVFITADRNLTFQQETSGFNIAVVVPSHREHSVASDVASDAESGRTFAIA